MSQAQAHMTFGQTSVGKTVRRTGLFLKKQLWIWPIIAVFLLSIAGWAVSSSINYTMKTSLKSELSAILTIERAMLEKWLKVQEANAQAVANDPQIRKTALQLIAANKRTITPNGEPSESNESPSSTLHLQSQFYDEIEANMSAHDFVGFALADRHQRIIAAETPSVVGQVIPQYEDFLRRTFEGQPTVSPPFPSVALLKNRDGRMRTETPTMYVSAPIRDDNLQVVAVLAMRISPEREFTEILQLGRLGESGETYAVDKQGLMVSNSRFDEQLMFTGLLKDQEGSSSILNIQVRDPGGNMATGFRPKIHRSELPHTKSCASVIAGESGVTTESFHDYRGVDVVGAWTWMPQYQFGLITEIDSEEAFKPLTILNRSFYWLYGLLVASAVAIFGFTVIVARLQREAQKAAIEAKQLGQYRLETRLGAGAMGVVYKGQHAMLRRPTAIKMLQLDKINESAIARFEREVQITCKLNHPNTIAIYDFGRTPEGVFYYAMEYLDGIDLQTLVDRFGPQPEARVVYILQQICGSLYEAHLQGLVHRDIKPANIMLNRRGGEADVVKVLDFGLVKTIDDAQTSRETEGLSGTPLYMSPESIQTPDSVDARSDLYAVGAVGYFLLTGQTVFQAITLGELCQQHIIAPPETPSHRLGQPVSEALENALLACLEKSRTKRPQTARDLSHMLDASNLSNAWTNDDAEGWWIRHERQITRNSDGMLIFGSSHSRTSLSNVSSSNRTGMGGSSSTIGSKSPSNNSSATSASGFDQTIAPGD